MKRSLILIAFLFILNETFSQNGAKYLDLILMVDEKLPTCCITRVHIKIEGEIDSTLKAIYYPGRLTLDSTDYNFLMSSSIHKIFLFFDFDDYKGSTRVNYNYKIEIKKQWLLDDFNVLKIYNLDNKKYRNKIKPIEKGSNYNYELESPSNTFILIRNN